MTSAVRKAWAGTRRSELLLFAACLLVGIVLSIVARTDTNWDLQNYHLYAPYAALTHRLGLDYFAGGFQAYLNPLEDIPYYLAKFVVFPTHPVVVAGLAGVPFGILCYITLSIAGLAFPAAGKWSLVALFAALIGLTGATIQSEIGTVYDDIITADVVLGGVWAAMAYWHVPRRVGLALGLAIGCAAALKLTALVFAPGAVAMVLLAATGRREAIGALSRFCVAAAIGFLALYAWWGWRLWHHFGDPFFPLFAGVFHSPWHLAGTVRDTRFLPRDVLQWIAYPFFWLSGKAFVVTEEPLRDPRFALAYLALLALLVVRPAAGRRLVGLWLFVAIGYGVWLAGFSILRYAVPLEALTGIVIWSAVTSLAAPRRPRLVLALLLAGCLAVTKPIGWGRIGYSQALVEPPVPALPADSLVFVAGAPLGFVIPYLRAQDARFIALGALSAESPEIAVLRRLIAQRPPVYVLTNLPVASLGRLRFSDLTFSNLGLSVGDPDCTPLIAPEQRGIDLCRLAKAPTS